MAQQLSLRKEAALTGKTIYRIRVERGMKKGLTRGQSVGHPEKGQLTRKGYIDAEEQKKAYKNIDDKLTKWQPQLTKTQRKEITSLLRKAEDDLIRQRKEGVPEADRHIDPGIKKKIYGCGYIPKGILQGLMREIY